MEVDRYELQSLRREKFGSIKKIYNLANQVYKFILLFNI